MHSWAWFLSVSDLQKIIYETYIVYLISRWKGVKMSEIIAVMYPIASSEKIPEKNSSNL